uniref:Uncharacterized protein n=1 Tax=Molossus molossus TaxID=27622 RepID=A0A7J8CZ31_MOLMO|nr:hypothetical protein HJG59_009417 [Molossus molossus]
MEDGSQASARGTLGVGLGFMQSSAHPIQPTEKGKALPNLPVLTTALPPVSQHPERSAEPPRSSEGWARPEPLTAGTPPLSLTVVPSPGWASTWGVSLGFAPRFPPPHGLWGLGYMAPLVPESPSALRLPSVQWAGQQRRWMPAPLKDSCGGPCGQVPHLVPTVGTSLSGSLWDPDSPAFDLWETAL